LNADEILKIIQSLPEYIKYIFPGYLSMYTYLFLRGKTIKDNSYIIMKSIAISYIYLWVLEWIKDIECLNNIEDIIFKSVPYELKQSICLVILGIVFPYVFYRIITLKKTQTFLSKLKIQTTFYDNEIEMLAEFNEGAWLCVYLNDDEVVYEGSLGNKELDDDKRKYICLNSYYKYLLDEEGKPKDPYIEDHEKEPEETVMIFYDSVKRIEKRN
jgi:hypothetical protein